MAIQTLTIKRLLHEGELLPEFVRMLQDLDDQEALLTGMIAAIPEDVKIVSRELAADLRAQINGMVDLRSRLFAMLNQDSPANARARTYISRDSSVRN